MKIVADENILAVADGFRSMGDLVLLPGREIGAADVRDADALVVRSITRVDRALLEGSSLRFVATATSGTNHLDLDWLQEAGIHVSDAAGCNANAVAEYVLAALTELVLHDNYPLLEKRVAIIGCGHVGRSLLNKLLSLGIAVQVCDPFVEADYTAAGGQLPGVPENTQFCNIDEALTADIVTLHIPLTDSGPHPTAQLLNAQRIDALASGTVFINAARGEVVDEVALKRRVEEQGDLLTILDVFEDEPEIDRDWCQLARIATPHLAGYSADAKTAATRRVLEAFCDYFGEATPSLPVEGEAAKRLEMRRLDSNAELQRFAAELHALFSPMAISRDFCGQINRLEAGEPLAPLFDSLRKSLTRRREFSG